MACKRSKGMSSYNAVTSNTSLACERALRGALAAGSGGGGGGAGEGNEVTWYVFTTLQVSQGLASCKKFLVFFSGTWIRIP